MTAPVVALRRITAVHVEADLALPADHPAFAGHFPGRPILPGVIQLDWAIELAASCFGYARRPARRFQVKYSRLVEPAAAGLCLTLRLDRGQNRLLFEYRMNGLLCAGGRVTLEP